ncbi:hypothetical protein NCC49_000155 [Naganishia albida]|nr:hypothetical protein NCC49_000155 [Naganishia albida]
MSLRLTSTSTSTIRHHLRTLGSRIPHQWINIALLLPVAVFLALYAVNERRSGRIKSELEYERVVWPQYFGFPEWYRKPSLDRFAAGEERELEKDSVLPGKSLKTFTEPLQRPIRVLGLIPSNPHLHQQAVFLHHLANAGKYSGTLDVTLREAKELEGENVECWEWVWAFEDCGSFLAITLLTEADNQQIRSVLSLLYGDSFKHTNSPPPIPDAHQIGLIHQSLPSADPSTFFPDRGMSGRKRKRVTLFLGSDMQKRLTDDLGRKKAIKDHLPGGWTVFFEKDPLQPSTWHSLTGKQSPSDWGEATARRLANDEEIANTMRHSGICVFEADWAGEVVSERMAQAMLSGCVVATVTPPVFKNPLKSLTTSSHSHQSIHTNLLPQVIQISGIISAYTPEELDEKALWAFMFASETVTTQRKVQEVEELVKLWRAGGRGLQLPGGYTNVV